MGDEDYSTAKISVWWDIENCAVPASVNPHCIAQNVNSALRLANLNGPVTIDAFGDTKILKDVTQEALSTTGITLNHVPRGNKDAADKAILVGMLLWALDNPPPAYILLISGDGDFANALHRLRMKRYDILLARPDARVKPALFQAANRVWYWTSLARGQLSTSMNAENLEQPLSPKYAISDGSTKEYKDSGNGSYGMSSSAILQRLNTQTFVSSSGSGNFASQDLPPSPLLFPHPYPIEKPQDPAQKIPDVHKVSLCKVSNAMKILKKDMLTPTEANLQDCIQYWERQLDNFNLKRTLEKAVDQHEVELCVGAGGFKIFLPLNSQLWGCVDVGNMQSAYSYEVWMDFRRFLLNKHNWQLLAYSQNWYAAAQILKNKVPGGFGSLVVGHVMNLLQQAVEQKKWLEVHVAGWLPLSINVQALLDFRVSQAEVSSLDSGQMQLGLVEPAKYLALQDDLRKDVIFEKLRTWLVETLKEKSDYYISGVQKDFEKATGIRLDHKELGFPKLQQLIEKFADIVHIEGRKGLLVLHLVRQESLCEPLPSVKPRDSKKPGNQALRFDQSGKKLRRNRKQPNNSKKSC